jgi:hypothetical protein
MFLPQKINSLLNTDASGSRFGEKVQFLKDSLDLPTQLQESNAKYAILFVDSIKDNIQRTNEEAYLRFLNPLLNTTNNTFNKGNKLLILGSLGLSNTGLNPSPENDQVVNKKIVLDQLQQELTHMSYLVATAAKKLIVISANQQYSYGIIKGLSLATNKKINTINLNNLPKYTGKHSFGKAFNEGFFEKYVAFGIEETKISKGQIQHLTENINTAKFNTYEAMEVRMEKSFPHEMKEALTFINEARFGVEINANCFSMFPSNNGLNYNGYHLKPLRQFTSFFSTPKNSSYLHISEINFATTNVQGIEKAGQWISFLITDFIH